MRVLPGTLNILDGELPPDIHKASVAEIPACGRIWRRRRSESGANRHHQHQSGNPSVASAIHEEIIGGSTREPYTIAST
jgi:hypothetical protein